MKTQKSSMLFSLCLIAGMLLAGCVPAEPGAAPTMETAPVATSAPEEGAAVPTDALLTVAEAEKLAGFDVLEPATLPAGVSFTHATYLAQPTPAVILHYKIVHETLGDMGAFFQITQTAQGAAMSGGCSDCETVQAGEVSVSYRFTDPTESLMWEAGGYSFVLTRTAGEPGKVYKEELLKVAGSMQ